MLLLRAERLMLSQLRGCPALRMVLMLILVMMMRQMMLVLPRRPSLVMMR